MREKAHDRPGIRKLLIAGKGAAASLPHLAVVDVRPVNARDVLRQGGQHYLVIHDADEACHRGIREILEIGPGIHVDVLREIPELADYQPVAELRARPVVVRRQVIDAARDPGNIVEGLRVGQIPIEACCRSCVGVVGAVRLLHIPEAAAGARESPQRHWDETAGRQPGIHARERVTGKIERV